MNDKFAVIFNGPPGSGKDTICDYLVSIVRNTHHMRFKQKLFDLVMTIYNIDKDSFFLMYNHPVQKETPSEIFGGLSPRQAMIHVSENIIKPNFGKNYFGKMTAENMKPGMNVFSDGGFAEEFEPIYKQTDGNMIIIQLYRHGHDFSNDSRTYINKFKDVPIYELNNNYDIDNLIDETLTIIETHYKLDIKV